VKTEPLLAIILFLQSREKLSARELTKLHLKSPGGEA
jgi:hypothetical protein